MGTKNGHPPGSNSSAGPTRNQQHVLLDVIYEVHDGIGATVQTNHKSKDKHTDIAENNVLSAQKQLVPAYAKYVYIICVVQRTSIGTARYINAQK